MSRHHANAHESFRQNGSEANTSNPMAARTDEIAGFLASGQVLERSVVLLTPVNIADVTQDGDWLHTAWHLANLSEHPGLRAVR